MRGLKDPRLQRMSAAMFIGYGVVVLVIMGPDVFLRPRWPPAPELEAELSLITAVCSLFVGCQILWRIKPKR
jgi:hypothetical protein